ncbi:DUF4123 domain-containing protein [Erwinia billingiae]|uniref:DUF4123 domain-containing protein n=1 Tax=Erwinia billingiae TaxID=182337 RepID=UPI0022484A31|nr:DUF4123 domain-containing protein [Erwinia billingiae]MCX0501604.1 DUF4123 domain-containing protein [Erwinia billingiae]
MDTTTLLQSVCAENEYHLSLLIEGGTQTADVFAALRAQHKYEMFPLYIHPQLYEARNYGPWLLDIKHKEKFGEYISKTPGVVGVIMSTRLPSALAVQLANGCSIITPDGTTALVRFHAHHVLSILALQNEQEWHALLFNGITQWWVPAKGAWQPIEIPASTIENPSDSKVKLSDEVWQQIADKPEVSSVLREWQKMPMSQHFTPCIQRDMVIKALKKAKEAGVATPLDQKVYALYYLNGGRAKLESDSMRVAVPNIVNGTLTLADVLVNLANTQY